MNKKIESIKNTLKNELDRSRYEHTIGVMYTAGALAMKHECDLNQAVLAGLLHDCAKCIPNDKKLELCKKNNIQISKAEQKSPFLLHAKLGAWKAKTSYGVHDEKILHAIKVHTTGAPDMSLLDKIVFIADYIEPNRMMIDHLTEIRKTAFENIDQAVALIARDSLEHLKTKSFSVDPLTEETYAYYKQYLKGE